MRTLSDTLTAAQKTTPKNALIKIVLTQGANEYTYTKSRILISDHREESLSQKAEVLLDNSDGALTSLDFKGYKGVISYGINTSAGDEYSACAPLYVIPQSLQSRPGRLTSLLSLKGIPDLLDDDRASGIYFPELADTVKDVIAGILGATISVYSHCTAYTVNWDSEDAVIDSFSPKQTIRIMEGMTRKQAILLFLQFTKCMILFKADGQAYVSVPKISGATWTANTAYAANDYVQPSTPNNNFTYQCTVAGTSHATTEPTWPTTAGNTVSDGTVTWTARAHDYTYTTPSTAGAHPFYSKSYGSRLVIPNYFTVASLVGDSPAYSGYATDPDYTLIRKDDFLRIRAASNAQCTSIAKANIAKAQLSRDGGSINAPLNVGAEALDYIKATDNIESDTLIGNCGYVHRKVNLTKNQWEMDTGIGSWLAAQGMGRSLVATALGTQLGEGAVTNVSLGIFIDVGDTLLHSNDTSSSSTSTSYVKVREILIPCFGYFRVKFDLAAQESDPPGGIHNTAYGRIYKNGVALGAEQSKTGDTSFVTLSEDLSGFKPGDLLQLYVKQVANGGANTVYYKNFRLYWDPTGQPNPYTPAFVNTL